MARGFEKISFSQFSVDISDDRNLYDEYNLPIRSTSQSAGYDFRTIQDFTIRPGEIVKIPTGIKVYMNPDEMLMLVVRSSVGFKYNVRLCNQVGIIDSDYYNNETNEGNIWVSLQNHGDKDFVVKKGEVFVQGIFTKYLITDNETESHQKRVGGFGSTNNRRDKNE